MCKLPSDILPQGGVEDNSGSDNQLSLSDITVSPGAETFSENDVRHTLQMTRREAELYRRAGIGIGRKLPSDGDGKNPKRLGWAERSSEPGEFQAGDGLMILPGWLSELRPGYILVVIDLDWKEAAERHGEFMPPTPWKSGRKSKPIDRLYYLLRVESIPPHLRADVTGGGINNKGVQAAYRAGKHPGCSSFGFSAPRINPIGKGNNTGLEVFRWQCSGGQSISPPTVHAESGERRMWFVDGVGAVESFADVLAVADAPTAVEFGELAACCARFAEAFGAFNPHLRPAPKPEKGDGGTAAGSRSAGKRKRVKETTETVHLTPDYAVPATRYEWIGWDTVPVEERERRCRAYLRKIVSDGGLPRSHQNGHGQTFRIANIIANDFALFEDREKCVAIIEEEVNAPLTALGDGWSASEVAHKIAGAIAKVGRDEEHPLGYKLRRRGDVLRNWAERPAKVPEQVPGVPGATPAPELRRFVFGRLTHNGTRCKVTAFRCKDKADDGVKTYDSMVYVESEDARRELAGKLRLKASQVLWSVDQRRANPDAHAEVVVWSDDIPADGELGIELEEAAGGVFGRPLAAITDDALAMLDDNLAAAGGMLFTVAGNGAVRYLTSPSHLIAAVGDTAGGDEHNVDWRVGPGLATQEQWVASAAGAVPQFDDVTEYPHFPPVAGLYYTRPAPPPGDGSALDKLVGFFAPETEIDRTLIKAMFVTCLWGGPPGARPAFMVRGPEDDPRGGRGVGKSTLGTMTAHLVGGSVDVGMSDKVNDIRTRLLSPGGRNKRLVLWDNIKALKLSNGDYEGLITAPTVSGRQLYEGEGDRPNLITFIMTMNDGSLSSDFAQRCITIRVRRPENYTASWQATVEDFIVTNREAIFADCAAVVERASQVGWGGRTRWARWESGTLAGCCADAAEVARVMDLVVERQNAENGDDANAESISDAISEYILLRSGSPVAGVYELSKADLAGIVRRTLDLDSKAEATALQALTTHAGAIPQIVKRKHKDTRRVHYFWVGSEHPKSVALQAPESTAGALLEAAYAQTESDKNRAYAGRRGG